MTITLKPEVNTVRRYRLLTLLMTATLAAACSAQGPTGAAPTNGSDGGQPTAATGPDVTQGTEATPASGGGGGGGGANSVHFEVTSALLNKSGDLPFVPLASVFAGDANTSLSFADATTTDVMGVLIIAGNVAISYSSNGTTVAGPVCTATNLQVGASSASGSFDCQNADVLTTSGGIGKGEIKGTFSGSK